MRADLSETWVPYNSEFMARTWRARATLEREAANARLLLASSQAAFVALMNG